MFMYYIVNKNAWNIFGIYIMFVGLSISVVVSEGESCVQDIKVVNSVKQKQEVNKKMQYNTLYIYICRSKDSLQRLRRSMNVFFVQ